MFWELKWEGRKTKIDHIEKSLLYFSYLLCNNNMNIFSSVSYICECLSGKGRPPNCERPVTPTPSTTGCPNGEVCNDDCINDRECQTYFRDTRLVCHRGLCVTLGCQEDSECLRPNKDKCEKKMCDPCGDCPRGQICQIRYL